MKSFTIGAFVLSTLLQAGSSIAASCAPISGVKVTFYGWPDNSPPGPANAFNCGRGTSSDGEPIAGGSGTYSDPISLATATDNQNIPQCGLVYVPSLQKYFRNEDDCAECKSDWDSGQQYHVDLWTGSNSQSGGGAQTDCENNLPGGSLTIINGPPNGLPVDTTPLFDVSSGNCYKKAYPVNDASSLCSGGSSGGSNSSSPAGSSTFAGPQGSSTARPSGGRLQPTTLATVTTGVQLSPSGASCTWAGHCLGDKCRTYDDCDGSNVCTGGVCVADSGSGR